MENNKKKTPTWLIVVVKIIEWAIIFTLIGCMLVLLSQKICGETPSLFGHSIYTVVTDSMEPEYKVGDVIICKNIKKIDQNSVKENDVVVFVAPYGFDTQNKLEGKIVTHRIIEGPFLGEDGDWYIKTKGDNALDKDRVDIPLDNVKGIAVGGSRVISKLVAFISKWYGFALIIALPLILVLVLQIRALIKEKESADKKELEKNKEKELEKIKQEYIEKQEQIKKKAIEEYLEKEKEESGSNK